MRIQKQMLQSNTRSFETECGSLVWSSYQEQDFFREVFFIYQVQNERNLKMIWKFVKIVKLPKQRDKLASNDVVPESKFQYQKSKTRYYTRYILVEGFWDPKICVNMEWFTGLPGVTSSSFAQNPVSASLLVTYLQYSFETRLEPEFILCIVGIGKYAL